MNGLLIIVVTYIGFLLAYRWYGKRLGAIVFGLIASNKTPAHVHQDGHDFVPSKKGLVFGHHFTSIAGTGPIVGPAIGVIWGWLPALIWVVFGSIFMGAVHDLGALVVSFAMMGAPFVILPMIWYQNGCNNWCFLLCAWRYGL